MTATQALKRYFGDSVGCELRGDQVIVFAQGNDREIKVAEIVTEPKAA